jgi:hypothetical protein
MSIVKLNNQGVKNATAFGSITGLGSMIFIKKLTASSSATLSFVDGASSVVLDNTYKEYVFTFNNIHAQTNGAKFQFQGDTSSNTNYNQQITSTNFRAYHDEAGSGGGIGYITGGDQANGTAFQTLTEDQLGGDADQSLCGNLHIFNPSSTTFVKHFIARTFTNKNAAGQVFSIDDYVAGYFNLTTALTTFQFKMSSGNIDSGKIKLYGIKDS